VRFVPAQITLIEPSNAVDSAIALFLPFASVAGKAHSRLIGQTLSLCLALSPDWRVLGVVIWQLGRDPPLPFSPDADWTLAFITVTRVSGVIFYAKITGARHLVRYRRVNPAVIPCSHQDLRLLPQTLKEIVDLACPE
jgi:hypothetical protein